MTPETPKSHGHPSTVAAVVGGFSFAVGLLMRISGVTGGVDRALWESYAGAGFANFDAAAGGGVMQPGWEFALVGLVVFGMAFLILEIPGTPRRVMFAVTVLVLVAAGSPVLALWGVYWSPVVVVVSGGWSAFCATLWARHHAMPCERMEELKDGKVISITEEPAERRKRG